MDLYMPPSVAYGGAYSIRPYNRVRARVQKTDLYTPPSVASGGAYSIRPYNWARVILRNTDAMPQPGTHDSSKNCLVFVPFGAAYGAYATRPYNRVRAALRKTTPFSSSSRPRGGAYLICPYDRVPVPLQNTDAIPQPGTCEGSKNRSVFVPFEAAVWGVCNTPLQLATCNPLKYRCDLSIGGAGVFGRWGVGVTVCGGDGRG